jgi:hypothetical protein
MTPTYLYGRADGALIGREERLVVLYGSLSKKAIVSVARPG